MHHICAAVAVRTAAPLGICFAQDIPTDTSSTLAAEWKAPASASNCLTALGIYTTYTLPGSAVPLSPKDAADAALAVLLTGIPPANLVSITDLYTVAQGRADFIDRLAKANTLNTPAAGEASLFLMADALIQAIYGTPPGKQDLYKVQASSLQENYYLSIFLLPKAYPGSNPIAARSYADNLEILRACFKMNADRLNARTDERVFKRMFFVDKPSSFNDGLITVRTISGQSTVVNTTSQSFLNASTAPELNTLLSSLTASNTAAPGTNALAGAVLSANPLSRFTALAGALANYQTTFAQIGRGLQFSAIPRSLRAASSAEIAVTLNADESASGPTYTGGGASNPALNTSRVASHDTTTRVRVDSVKLFEISSLTAIVERSRSRFPLLPPFVEIPYIGTILGIPLPAAKEYNSSTAILSAYVVPTAADIAYGLRFVSDLVVDGLNPGPCSFFKGAAGPDVTNTCIFRRALSLRDLRNQPVNNFNKEMIRCLANNTSTDGCQRSVSFDSVPDTN
jgi:hypothetical protein